MIFFVRTFAVVTMKIYMNKTTIYSLTITLWGHHLFSVALTKDYLSPGPSPKEREVNLSTKGEGSSEARALIQLLTH